MPMLLAMGGHDPSGGAGVVADVQVAAGYGFGCYSIITCLTEQHYSDFRWKRSVGIGAVNRQLRAVAHELRPVAVKVGLLGGVVQLRAVAEACKWGVPVVVDPVLTSGVKGKQLVSAGMVRGYQNLAERGVYFCPNGRELEALGGAQHLLELGAGGVVVTGGDRGGAEVKTEVHAPHTTTVLRHDRVEGEFHGSGCSFASALACELGSGKEMGEAVAGAHRYVVGCLSGAMAMSGQSMPNRVR